ncbi:MAG: FkbM family methyltransferase [Planctomycetaceae bacterium]
MTDAVPGPGGLVEMVLPDGRAVLTLCRDNTAIAYGEIFSERIYELFGITLEDGATVLDVGANVGLAVMWVGDRISHGTVHALEPIPATFAALETNVARHVRLDVHLHHVGAADRAGTAEFTFYPLTSTSSSMYPDESAEAHAESRAFIRADLAKRLGWVTGILPSSLVDRFAELIRRRYQRASRVPCRLVRISDLIAAHGIARVDLLKIDVEGAEFDAVAGIDAEHWPRIGQVIVEVHEGAAARARIERLLTAVGFATVSYQQAPLVFPRHWLVYARRGQPAPATARAHSQECLS